MPYGHARTVRVPGFTLTLGRHAAGSALPRHEHPDPTICYVLRGGFTEYSGGEAVDCAPSTWKLMPAGEPHWNHFGDRETRGLRIDVDRARFADVPRIFRALDERHHGWGGRAGAVARRLVIELSARDDTASVAAEGLALELVAELARMAEEEDRSRSVPRWLKLADELIRARYRDRITVTELAAEVGVHPATLSRSHRKWFGCAIGERIRRMRVEHAARDLVETSESLSEVALRAGFYDQSHFTNLFHRVVGVTPRTYRERLAGPES